MIVFAPKEEANKAVDTIRKIHNAVEENRGAVIPDWAYRDVLFMLIHYSIAAYELLEAKLSETEKEEVYNVFYRVGVRMGLKELPPTYVKWLPVREAHLDENLQQSKYTFDLFKQYKKHLGAFRFKVLLEGQKLVCPNRVKSSLLFNDVYWLAPVVSVYKLSRIIKMDGVIKNLLLPSAYKTQIKELDIYQGKPDN